MIKNGISFMLEFFKNQKKNFILLFASFCFFSFSAYAKVSFADLALNDNGSLLYSVQNKISGSPVYKTLYKTELGENFSSGDGSILTCFPEHLEILDGGKKLQIRNRYGTALYSVAESKLEWVSIANKIPLEYTRTGIYSVSPDGKWAVYVKQTDFACGQMILQNTLTRDEMVLAENSPFSYERVNVKWSPSSASFIYEKNGNLYFTTPSVAFKNIQLPEEYRKIGEGGIKSIEWCDDDTLIYIRDDIVYKINGKELYTRGLYSSLIGSGKILARLNFSFDSSGDVFFVDKTASQIVLITKEKTLSYCSIGNASYDYVKLISYLPLTSIRGTALSYKIFWTGEMKPVLWIDILNYKSGKKTSSVYEIGTSSLKPLLDINESLEPKLSPDKRRIAFTAGSSIFVYDTTTWKPVSKLSGEKVISFVWASNTLLYVGGEYSVRMWKLDSSLLASSALYSTPKESGSGISIVLFLSSAFKAFWDGEKIICENGGNKKFYLYDTTSRIWHETKDYEQINPHEKNGSFRVFLGKCKNRNFENEIFVRSLSGKVVTYPLHPESDTEIPESKKIALVVDAMDGAEGLDRVLTVLKSFGVNATFFINGEFIRRYPLETIQIVSSGYECGSGFYSDANLLQSNFIIDENFIRSGLARNEDEFFALTGKELSLLWHAPFYVSNSQIKKAGENAGYRYIEAYTKYNDWGSLEDTENSASKNLYLTSTQLIEKLAENLYDSMIIPVTLGKASGSRKDYLYENLDLLLAAIFDSGAEVVGLRDLE